MIPVVDEILASVPAIGITPVLNMLVIIGFVPGAVIVSSLRGQRWSSFQNQNFESGFAQFLRCHGPSHTRSDNHDIVNVCFRHQSLRNRSRPLASLISENPWASS